MGEENIINDKTETKGMSNRKKILSLQGLRAVMFFLIFFFHSDLYLDRYFVFNRFFIGGVLGSISILCPFGVCYRFK